MPLATPFGPVAPPRTTYDELLKYSAPPQPVSPAALPALFAVKRFGIRPDQLGRIHFTPSLSVAAPPLAWSPLASFRTKRVPLTKASACRRANAPPSEATLPTRDD